MNNKSLYAELIGNNPLIYRYGCSLFRQDKLFVVFGCYFVLMLFYMITIGNHDRSNQASYHFFMFIEFALLWIAGPHMTSTALGQEIENKNIDFFRMLPLSPRQKAVGIVVGRNQLVLLVAGINILIAFMMAVPAGKVSMFWFNLLVLVTGAFFLNNLALAMSLKYLFKGGKSSSGIGVLFGIIGMVGISLTMGVNEKTTWSYWFIKSVSPLVVVSIFLAYLGCINFHCSLRMINYENAPALSRKAAILWAAGVVLLILGGYVSESARNAFREITLMEMLIFSGGIAVYFLALGFKNYGHYWQMFADLKIDKKNKPGLVFFYNSNVMTAVFIFAIGAGAAIAMAVWTNRPSNNMIFEMVSVMFLTLLLPLLIAEICIITSEKYSKLPWLMAVVYIAYLLLPLMTMQGSSYDDNGTMSIFQMGDYFMGRQYKAGSTNFYTFTAVHALLNAVALGVVINMQGKMAAMYKR